MQSNIKKSINLFSELADKPEIQKLKEIVIGDLLVCQHPNLILCRTLNFS